MSPSKNQRKRSGGSHRHDATYEADFGAARKHFDDLVVQARQKVKNIYVPVSLEARKLKGIQKVEDALVDLLEPIRKYEDAMSESDKAADSARKVHEAYQVWSGKLGAVNAALNKLSGGESQGSDDEDVQQELRSLLRSDDTIRTFVQDTSFTVNNTTSLTNIAYALYNTSKAHEDSAQVLQDLQWDAIKRLKKRFDKDRKSFPRQPERVQHADVKAAGEAVKKMAKIVEDADRLTRAKTTNYDAQESARWNMEEVGYIRERLEGMHPGDV